MKEIFKVILMSSYRAVFLYRLSSWLNKRGLFFLANIIKEINISVNGCEISPYAEIGKNFRIIHTLGIVIGSGTKIGDNVTIYQNVTIGTKAGGGYVYPKINDDVTIFSNATILGNVEVGEGSTIGANSLVLKNVQRKSVVFGIPAKKQD